MNAITPKWPVAGRSSERRTITPASEAIDSILPEEIFLSHANGVGSVPRRASVAPKLPRNGRIERAAGALRRGALVDNYQVEEVLGVGGFAVVYRAIHLLLRRFVAIKMLRQDVVTRQPGTRSYLLDEARLAARVSHPNVVRIYDAIHSEQLTYIVMEFINGPSLSRRLDHGPLGAAAALRVGMDVAAGLLAGLKQDLIHRDVKPANVLISQDGTAKLVDFGMARDPQGNVTIGVGGRPLIVGTRGYMAPEQSVDSTRIDFRADIYSLGVTLLEAATGARRQAGAARDAALPKPFFQLIQRMRAPAPDSRPASYEALIDEMKATLAVIEDAHP